jgi:hypothetical protein
MTALDLDPDPRPDLTPVADHPRLGIARVHTITRPARPPERVPIARAQATLALELEGIAAPSSRPGLRLVTGVDRELDVFAARFAQAVVEVIGGDRGVHQLMRWTTQGVYADLTHRSHALHRATPSDQRLRRLRATVRSVHLFRPDADAAELSIHVRHGARSRAIAARIERIEGRWRCSVLDFG